MTTKPKPLGPVGKLLSTPKKWTQGGYARSANGSTTGSPKNKRAVSWCLEGAINRCYSEKRVGRILLKVTKYLGIKRIAHWNDDLERTFADVENLLKETRI